MFGIYYVTLPSPRRLKILCWLHAGNYLELGEAFLLAVGAPSLTVDLFFVTVISRGSATHIPTVSKKLQL